jgi:hypothetical protein
MKFNRNDLNQELLHARVEAEAIQIFAKPSTRKDRTYKEIYDTCLYGQSAECYLMEFHKFTDDPRPYHDTIDPNGIPTEQKVTSKESYVKDVLRRCNEAALNSYRQYAKKLYIFIGDKDTLDYYFYSSYCYNSNTKQFVKE